MLATTTQVNDELVVDEAICLAVADYVKTDIGEAYDVVLRAYYKESNLWSFTVQCQFSDLNVPIVAGYITVDSLTGRIVPLTDDQIWDFRERTRTRAEHKRGNNPARSDDGLILPYQAKVKATVYAGNTVGFYVRAEGKATFISGEPPVWRFMTYLRLLKYGRLAEVGTIDINAITGEAIPLADDVIQARQKAATDAALIAKRSAKPGS